VATAAHTLPRSAPDPAADSLFSRPRLLAGDQQSLIAPARKAFFMGCGDLRCFPPGGHRRGSRHLPHSTRARPRARAPPPSTGSPLPWMITPLRESPGAWPATF